MCVCVCVYVHMPIWFSCAHSTGQKTESTATDPSRWSLSPLIWKRTSSAEYSGSTMRLGYGNTKWTSYKQKKHSVWSAWCVVVGFFFVCFFLLCCPFICNFWNLFVFPAVKPIYSVTAHLTHPTHTSACPFKLCRGRVIVLFNYATAPVDWMEVWLPQVNCLLDSLRKLSHVVKKKEEAENRFSRQLTHFGLNKNTAMLNKNYQHILLISGI